MRFILGISLACAGLAFAQAPGAPATIQLVIDEDQLLVGRSAQLRAVVRDAQGRARTGDVVLWRVNNAAMGTINQQGELRATGLGIVRVVAQVGNVTGEVPVQTMPREVRISPSSATLNIGQEVQFRAVALDADGNPINNAAFTWAVTNRNGGGTSLARTNTLGMVTGVFEGGAMVRATYTYNENIVGMQRQWLVQAPLEISAPRAYEVKKLVGNLSQMQTGFNLRARQSMIWTTDDGQMFFNAALDGTANGLLNWKDGEWKLVSAAAEPRFVGGSFATDFGNHCILPGSGKILATESTNINGTQINRGSREEGLTPFLSVNAPLAGMEGANSLTITRNSCTDSGWVLVRATFRIPGFPTTYTGLFRGFGDRITELLVHTGETVPGFAPGSFGIDGDFGIDENGVAVYSLTAGAIRVFYRHQSEAQKLIAVGDPLLGSSVRSFQGGRGTAPAFFVSQQGEVVLSVVLNDNTQQYLRFRPTASAPQTIRVNSQAGVLSHHPEAGTLLYANPFQGATAQGNGAWIWKNDGTVQRVAVIGQTTVADQSIQEIESGALMGNGHATLMLRMNQSPLLITRFPPEGPWVIAQHGDRVPVRAPWNMITFVGGARSGPPILITGPSSISWVDGKTVRPLVATGERLFGSAMYFGSSVNNSNWNARRAPNGDLYFTTGLGLARIRMANPEPELFLRFPITQGTLTINAPFWVDANANGEVFWVSSTNQGDNRLYITKDGQHKEILAYSGGTTTATTIDGRIATGVDSYILGGDGRVMANIRFRNDTPDNIYVWDGSRWNLVVRVNETRIGRTAATERVITGISRFHRAGGNRLFTLVTVAGGSQLICELRGGRLEIVFDNTQVMVHGQVYSSTQNYDVNSLGDVFFQHNPGIPYLMASRGETNRVVQNLFRLTAEGEYILRINAIDFRDDGTVYFLAMTSEDETALYVATPLN
jgi:hypothetical protein